MKYNGRTFRNEIVELDDNEFAECVFENCKLVYHGGEPPVLLNNHFIGVPELIFADAAGKTIDFMTGLYRGGFGSIIDATLDNIRSANHKRVPKDEDPLDSGIID